MKPFKTTLDLIIKRDVGGVWKFPISLEALPPDIDDLIIISSPLHKTSSVSFKLTNRIKNFAPFTAAFTAVYFISYKHPYRSDQELSISPK
jgi:hypothetical protein